MPTRDKPHPISSPVSVPHTDPNGGTDKRDTATPQVGENKEQTAGGDRSGLPPSEPTEPAPPKVPKILSPPVPNPPGGPVVIPLESKPPIPDVYPRTAIQRVSRWMTICAKTVIPTVVTLAIGFVGLAAVYAYVQVLSFINTIALYPVWLASIVLLGFAVLTAVVIAAFGKLCWKWLSLRTVKKQRLSDIDAVTQYERVICTDNVACVTNDKRKEICEALRQYVEHYPKYDNQTLPLPLWFDLSKDDLQQLESMRICLIKSYAANTGWIDKYKKFQEKLDTIADKRISTCARWAAYKTALCPYPIGDMLITAYWSFTLVSNLCTIYNLKIGRFSTLLLVCQIAGTIFLSGKIDKMEDYTATVFESVVGGLMSSEIIKMIVGQVSAKAVSGLANYYLISRVGKYVKSELQPLI
jgi:hypothetical protein